MKTNNRKMKYYILSFFIPIFIFVSICIVSKIYPFGNRLLNLFDSYKQYPSMLIEMVTKIKNHESLFYTLHGALGTNFYSIMCYYTLSPLNLLFLFFKTNQIYLFYAILIYLKMGLSSLCLFIFFNNKSNNNKVNLLFSCIYALSSFLVVYCYHIVWSDAFYLAPLVLLGIDKIVDGNKSYVYIIFLTLAIIINFLTGYMLCIFSVIYFIYRIININSKRKEIIKKFILSSIICGLLSSFILIPTAVSVLQCRSINFLTNNLINYSNLKSLFYNLLPGSFRVEDNFNNGSCVICASIFVLVLNILYFFNTKINKKEKITTLSIYLFFILSLIISPIDYFWNMLSIPIWWNSRYSFLIILFMIIVAHKSYLNLNSLKITKKYNLMILLFYILFIVSFSLKILGTQPPNLVLYMFALSLILFLIYMIIIPKNIRTKKILIMFLIFFEITLNSYYLLNICKYSIQIHGERSNYKYQLTKYNKIKYEMNDVQKIIESIKENDNSFFRTYNYNDTQENDGLMYGFNSVQLFSSSYNKRINEFYTNYLKLNGIKNNYINHTIILYPNLETLTLINTKYLLYYNHEDLTCIKNNNICTNAFALPLGFLIEDKDSIKLVKENSLNNLENIYKYLSNTRDSLYYNQNGKIILKNIKITKDTLKLKDEKKNGSLIYEFTANHDGILSSELNYYLYLKNSLYINNKPLTKGLLTHVNKGDKVKLIINLSKETQEIYFDKKDLTIKILDINKFKSITNNLSKNSLNIEKSKSHILTGKINVKENNKKLFMTIPYDESLIVKLDNKKVKINEEFNTFISINLKKGKHTITIDYFPKGLKLGILISCITIFCLIIKKIVKYQ